MTIGKLFDFLALFRKGNAIANVEAWEDGGNAATLLVPILLLLVKIAGDFGYGIQLSQDDAIKIALGIVTVVQFVVHNVTSKHAGLMPAKPAPAVVPEAAPAPAATEPGPDVNEPVVPHIDADTHARVREWLAKQSIGQTDTTYAG